MRIMRKSVLNNILIELSPEQLMDIKIDYGLTETELQFLKRFHNKSQRSSGLFFSIFD